LLKKKENKQRRLASIIWIRRGGKERWHESLWTFGQGQGNARITETRLKRKIPGFEMYQKPKDRREMTSVFSGGAYEKHGGEAGERHKCCVWTEVSETARRSCRERASQKMNSTGKSGRTGLGHLLRHVTNVSPRKVRDHRGPLHELKGRCENFEMRGNLRSRGM